MRVIDEELLDEVSVQAKASPRLRIEARTIIINGKISVSYF